MDGGSVGIRVPLVFKMGTPNVTQFEPLRNIGTLNGTRRLANKTRHFIGFAI